MKLTALLVLVGAALTSCSGYVPPPEMPTPIPEVAELEAPPLPADSILLTIFLRHDQSKSLAEIQQLQEEQGFWSKFPPPGTAIVSWHVVMGIGQVVTLRVPPAKLREVNVSLERTAWKAFHTEYYATYDLWPVIASKLPNAIKEGTAGAAPAQPATVATEAPAPTSPPSASATPPPSNNPTTVKPPAPNGRPKAPPVPTTPGADPLFDGRK